jgi:hypothetical protein
MKFKRPNTPSAQVVWPIGEILNDVGGGFQGIQITSGFQLCASGITSELQLYSTAIGLVMAAAMFFWLVPLPQKCTKT